MLFEVEKIEQLALINRLTTHHDLRPSLKGSDDGIMIRQYPRGLFQQHRPKAVIRLIDGFCGSLDGYAEHKGGMTPA